MGVDLYGSGGYFGFNWAGWRSALELAEAHGWQPAGTEPPIDPETGGELDRSWDGDYFSNGNQLVTGEDAADLARALERALPEMSSEDPRWNALILEFVRFCRTGEFRIL